MVSPAAADAKQTRRRARSRARTSGQRRELLAGEEATGILDEQSVDLLAGHARLLELRHDAPAEVGRVPDLRHPGQDRGREGLAAPAPDRVVGDHHPVAGAGPNQLHQRSHPLGIRVDHVIACFSGAGPRSYGLAGEVDVEGQEPSTIRGLLGVLARFDRPMLWCEVRGPNGSTRAADTLTPVKNMMEGLGYRALKFDGTSERVLLPEDIAKSGSQDVLFTVDG